MKTITINELKDKLYQIGNKVPFIGMDVVTEPKVFAACDPIRKFATVAGRAGAHVKFPIGNRSWGERVQGTPLVAHKGNFYLEIEVTSVKNEVFMDIKSGEAVTIEEAIKRGYRDRPIDKDNPSANMRDFKLSSIEAIRLDGEEYVISRVQSST